MTPHLKAALDQVLVELPQIEDHKLKQKERVEQFLKQNKTPFLPIQIANMLNIPDPSCRRILGLLLKEGFVTKIKNKYQVKDTV